MRVLRRVQEQALRVAGCGLRVLRRVQEPALRVAGCGLRVLRRVRVREPEQEQEPVQVRVPVQVRGQVRMLVQVRGPGPERGSELPWRREPRVCRAVSRRREKRSCQEA